MQTMSQVLTAMEERCAALSPSGLFLGTIYLSVCLSVCLLSVPPTGQGFGEGALDGAAACPLPPGVWLGRAVTVSEAVTLPSRLTKWHFQDNKGHRRGRPCGGAG